MKLTARLVLAIIAGMFVLLTIDGILAAHREVTLFEQDMERDAHLVAHALRTVILARWEIGDLDGARKLVEDVNAREQALRVHWVPDDASASAPRAGPTGASSTGDDIASEWRDREADTSILVTSAPLITSQGEALGVLQITEPRDALQRYVRTTLLRRAVLVATLFVIAAATIFVLGVTMVGRPLHSLTHATRRIGAGDLTTRVALHGHNELDELGNALNAMASELEASQKRLQAETVRRLEALEELRHADRLRTVGRLASGIAHELGTPLNVVAGRATLIEKRELDDDGIAESAGIIHAQAQRMTEIVRQLLDFARRPRAERCAVDLCEIARSVQSLVEPLARKTGVTVAVEASGAAVTSGERAQLEQVVTNLVVNAVQASSSGGRVVVELGSEDAVPPPDRPRGAGRYARLRVMDHGQGIGREEIEHLFEPFFTTKDVGEGTGLGLSIVYSIVQDHEGWIDVTSDPENGTCFTVYLPGDGT